MLTSLRFFSSSLMSSSTCTLISASSSTLHRSANEHKLTCHSLHHSISPRSKTTVVTCRPLQHILLDQVCRYGTHWCTVYLGYCISNSTNLLASFMSSQSCFCSGLPLSSLPCQVAVCRRCNTYNQPCFTHKYIHVMTLHTHTHTYMHNILFRPSNNDI